MDGGISRRDVLRRGLAVGAALAVLPTPAFTLGSGGGRVSVSLADYPFFPGTTMRRDQKLLDRLARSYARGRKGDELVMTRFLFSNVPVTLFDRILGAKNPEELPLGSYLWLLHLSGYFGGVWLRGELVRTGHNAGLASFSDPQTQDDFEDEVADADAILEQSRASKVDVITYNNESLYDTPNPANPDAPERGLIDTFGYNEGYLLQIIDEPPAGLSTNAGVTCPADAAAGPLACEYESGRLKALRSLERTATKLTEGDGEYGSIAPRIVPLQTAGIARGRMVWDSLLNVQGFSQEAYDQLIDISVAFLETVQATALATVEAVAERDATIGRRAAVANACLKLWLRAYIVGVTDGRPERALPTFEVA